MSNKKQFFFNPSDNKKSFDVYKDKNPKDTKETIKKLEKLYKDGKYPHNRISKVAMILMVRLRIINPNDPRTKLAISYFNFLKERTKEKNDKKRKELKFKI